MGNTLDSRGKPIFDNVTDPVADLRAAVDWADRVGAGLRGTSTERTLLTSANIEPGQFFSETDTGAVYLRTAAGGWAVIHEGGGSGLVLLRKQSFASAAIVSVENVFSARFANYKLEVNVRSLSAAGAVGIQYLSGGSPATGGSDYFSQSLSASGSTVSAQGAAQSNMPLTKSSSGALILHAAVDLYDVSLAARTAALVRSHGYGGAAAGENSTITGHHNPQVAYNGFRLITSGAAITGEVSVYGVR